MRTRPLGWTKIEVSALGFGPMALSLANRPDALSAQTLLQAVRDEGITFFDTADTYCQGPDDLHHNERLISTALGSWPGTFIGTKGGTLRTKDGWQLDGRPERLFESIEQSYAALGGKQPIFLWQHHWPDPRWSIADMLAPVRRAVDAGLIRYVGVGNYSLDQLREACDLLPVLTIQNPYNLWNRDAERTGLLSFCETHDLVFLPYRPLGGNELARRLEEIPTVARLARDRDVSPQCLVIAWHLAQSPCLLPIPGSTCLEHVRDCLRATALVLKDSEVQQLNSIRETELPQLQRAARWSGHPPLSPESQASCSPIRPIP